MYRNVVDLSMPVSENTNTVYAGKPWLSYQPIATYETDIFTSMAALLFLHAGTHVDAPFHFNPHGPTIDCVPVSALVGEAVILDASHRKANEEISAADLQRDAAEQEQAGNAICPGDKVLIRTGWANMYQPPDRRWWEQSPYLAPAAAEWLVSKQVSAVGFDFAQDPTTRDIPRMAEAREKRILLNQMQDPPMPVHVILLYNGICQIENLINLDKIPVRRVFLVAAPLYLTGAEGANARVVALY